ncbi:hypothetical protein [Flavobacterium ajazii]|uniref:hypothetical protein n=1 Tax=Flavobacterium ajazii TaxID=2692318 RepID=UPI0013D2D361|nr:hypothetical protein [Flavobacterium ajazii]
METFIKDIDDSAYAKYVPDDTPEYPIYAEYMSNIILQLSKLGRLQFLTGTSSGQASFYYRSFFDGPVNASLYNNFLNQRISGQGTQYGVRQVGLTSDSFINSYLSVYLKLGYQLSKADKTAQQKIYNDVSATVKKITPLWNKYVNDFEPKGILKLNETNTDIALIQITDVLNTVWINPDYVLVLKKDPSYPYEHIDEFEKIYAKIPETVPKEMKELMMEIYSLSGKAGGVTAKIANAVHTIAMIIYNLKLPTEANKAIPLTGISSLVPGLTFDSILSPDDIINKLRTYPVVSYTNNNNVTKLSSDLLKVSMPDSEEIPISPLKFLSNTLENGEISSVFKQTFSGASYVVKAIVNNPVFDPNMGVNPVPFDILSNTGWMNPEPVKEAIQHGYPAPTDITGYVFNSEPNFNFKEGGDFGFINGIVFSQFLELYITFVDCNVKRVKKYFQQNKLSNFSFLGKPIGNPTDTLPYTCEVGHETNTTISVVIKPPPPGYIPPDSDITNSSCQLIAVEVVYPFAD